MCTYTKDAPWQASASAN